MNFADAKNAVIYDDNGVKVTFSTKCPSCGRVESLKRQTVVTAGTERFCGYINCSKCGNRYEVKIRR